MSKKEDEWLYQFPSTTVKWKVVPTGANATPFIGDANKLLYQTKNMMTFNKLDQLRSVRFILGNTGMLAEIIAGSAFGQDFIEIHVPSEVAPLIPSCSITLFNVPESIPPMHWYEDGIHDAEWLIANPGGELEIEGVDYIKTYYFYSSENCDTCLLDLTICDTSELQTTYGWTAPQTCKPFIFIDDAIPVNGVTENDHCIHGICQAEIIDFGGDENGSYFRWKAYTEWSLLGPTFVSDFTETGLGYLLLRGFTKFGDEELCTSISSVVKVDCCLKVLADRTPIIYWEKCVVEDWCVAPSSGTIEEDLDYFWQLGAWISMTLWAKENWCRPMTWAVTSGIGEITPSEDGTFGYYVVSYAELGALLAALDCEDSYQISIEGTDRCGTKDSITFISAPCCDDAAVLEVGYTTLAMACSGSQTLTAVGGCAPYGWSKTGGGTLTPAGDTLTALYTAPATNAECANNPTITLTDCCGGSAHIHIAVNCNTADADAYVIWVDNVTYYAANCGSNCGYGNGPIYEHIFDAYVYHCDGTLHRTKTSALLYRSPVSSPILLSNQVLCAMGINPVGSIYTLATTGWHLAAGPTSDGANCGCTDPGNQGCGTWNVNAGSNGVLDPPVATAIPGQNDAWDVRTDAMKTAGCCPLNPITGLPF